MPVVKRGFVPGDAVALHVSYLAGSILDLQQKLLWVDW